MGIGQDFGEGVWNAKLIKADARDLDRVAARMTFFVRTISACTGYFITV